MFKKISTFFVLLTLSLGVFAEIIEIDTMNKILSHIEKDTLVVFDLDNTVIETAQTLGSDQWFSQEISRNLSKGLNKTKALEKALEIYEPVQDKTSVTLVEPMTAKIILGLKNKGISVIALTARNQNLHKATFRQLDSVGISFSSEKFPPTPFPIKEGSTPIADNGVIFLDGKDKGEYLLTFLQQMDWHPEKIVFVDDKLKNVEQVERALNTTKIQHTSFRYGYLDTKVDSINMEVADIQLQFFNTLLSDKIVESLLKG